MKIKKIFFLIVIFLTFLLSSCFHDKEDELYAELYENATIEHFLQRYQYTHLRIHNISYSPEDENEMYEVVDAEDTIYNYIKSLDYLEVSYASKKDKCISFDFGSNSKYLILYSDDMILEVREICDGHLYIVSCSRYYQISEEDCNYIMECIEILKKQ